MNFPNRLILTSIAVKVSTEAKQYMTKWGEELLEVEQDLVDTPDLSVNQSTSNAQHHAQD